MSVPRIAIAGAGAAMALAAVIVAKWEGARYTPYQDSVGVWTVCVGHTGPDVIKGRKYTQAECDTLLAADMREANSYVRKCIGVPMLPQIEAALTSATFNAGPRVVCGSTIQRHAKANNWPAACAGLDAWKYAGGRVLQGLVNRRADERRLCEGRA